MRHNNLKFFIESSSGTHKESTVPMYYRQTGKETDIHAVLFAPFDFRWHAWSMANVGRPPTFI